MLALKKKREAEKAAAAAAAAGGEEVKQESNGNSAAAGGKQKTTPAEIRLRKDLTDIDIPSFVTLTPTGTKSLDIIIDLKAMNESIWKGGKYTFSVDVPNDYPHKPPKARLSTPIYHPNIDLDGNVCLNILRDDWSAVGDINLVVNGLIFLFLEPNPNDPLNHEAAQEFRDNEPRFKMNVARTLRGEYFGGRSYPKFI